MSNVNSDSPIGGDNACGFTFLILLIPNRLQGLPGFAAGQVELQSQNQRFRFWLFISMLLPRMALAAFNSIGDLPPGIHRATLEEVIIRFGGGTSQRGDATATLVQVMRLAQTTGKLDRLIVFGSYVSNKPA